jgi:phage-related protein
MLTRQEREQLEQFYTFYETGLFSRRLGELTTMETLAAIQADLVEDPQRWPVVKGTGGARKGRVADPHRPRGKSGGFRYLYLYLELEGTIYLLTLFAKSEQSDLTPEQAAQIAAAVERIKEAYRKE